MRRRRRLEHTCRWWCWRLSGRGYPAVSKDPAAESRREQVPRDDHARTGGRERSFSLADGSRRRSSPAGQMPLGLDPLAPQQPSKVHIEAPPVGLWCEEARIRWIPPARLQATDGRAPPVVRDPEKLAGSAHSATLEPLGQSRRYFHGSLISRPGGRSLGRGTRVRALLPKICAGHASFLRLPRGRRLSAFCGGPRSSSYASERRSGAKGSSRGACSISAL